jgi:hypothetical protein
VRSSNAAAKALSPETAAPDMPVLVVTPTKDVGDQWADELAALGLQGGAVRLAGPQGPHAIEAEFPDYSSHPAELWVQLNQTTDPFVIQLKLTKMPPEDVFRDLAGGAYYIYGVSRFIIYVAVPNGLAGERGAQAGPAQHTAVPKSDREKVLAI